MDGIKIKVKDTISESVRFLWTNNGTELLHMFSKFLLKYIGQWLCNMY